MLNQRLINIRTRRELFKWLTVNNSMDLWVGLDNGGLLRWTFSLFIQ